MGTNGHILLDGGIVINQLIGLFKPATHTLYYGLDLMRAQVLSWYNGCAGRRSALHKLMSFSLALL